jgi:hypothetical protein
MWVFTTHGFYSAVCDTSDSLGRLKVRARRKRHLENLKQRFGLKDDIIETTDSDYRFRILLPKQEWVAICTALAEDITYENFKGAVRETGDTKYEKALHRVWSDMLALQSK